MITVDFWNVIIKIKQFQHYCANQTKTTFGTKFVRTFYYFYLNMGTIPLYARQTQTIIKRNILMFRFKKES